MGWPSVDGNGCLVKYGKGKAKGKGKGFQGVPWMWGPLSLAESLSKASARSREEQRLRQGGRNRR